MSPLPMPTAQLAPLARDRNDGIGRLARRTQRGQGRRRLLVAGLIALSVLLGVGSAVFAATMLRSDETVGVQDRFGDAAALVTAHEHGMQFEEASEPTLGDLTAAQRDWLAQHAFEGELPTGHGSVQLPVDVQQALGMTPVTVAPEQVLARLGLPADDVLVDRTVRSFDPSTGQQRVLTTLDVTHPLAGSTYDAGDRTAPLTGQEGLLSPSFLDALDVEIGDTVEVPEVGMVEVVGTATRSFARSQQVAVVAPDRPFEPTFGSAETAVRFADEDDARAYGSIVDELTQDKIAALPEPTGEQAAAVGMSPDDIGSHQPYASGGGVELRRTYLSSFVVEQSLPTLVGGTVTALAAVVAAVVGACAFAVGVRRRIRNIGMLGAVGATPTQLRRLLRREGLVIGLSGAAIGAAAGLGMAFAAQPLAERAVDRDLQLVVPVVGTLLPVVVGGAGAYLAAVWPARTAARVPITSALAGRVPLGRVPGWLPVAGAIAAAAGVALLAELVVSNPAAGGLQALQLLAAVLLATLGTAVLGIPVIAGGGLVADRLPLLGRLALRDAARQRSRSAAAVAALVPVLAIPVAAGTVIYSEHARMVDGGGMVQAEDGTVLEQLPYDEQSGSTLAVIYGPHLEGRQTPPSEETVAAIAAELPAVEARAPITYLGAADLPHTASAVLPYAPDGSIDASAADPATVERFGWAWGERLALATPELLDLFGLSEDDLPDAGALVLDGSGGRDLPAEVASLQVVQFDPAAEPAGATGQAHRRLGEIDILRADDAVTGGIEPGVLVTSATAERLGLVETGRSELLRLAAVPSQAQTSAAWQAIDGTTGRGATMSSAPPFWSTPLGLATIAALAVLAVTLAVSVVAGMTSALAATESDDDVRKAVALGAPPSMRRRLHGLQAWWHTAIAAVLGSALGLAVAWAIVRSTAVVTEYGDNGEVLEQVRAAVTVPWLGLAGWVMVLPVLVGLVIAAVMRSAPLGAPRRRTA